MLKILTRAGLTGALTAALLGGSLLISPAANAAPHKIASDMKHSTISFKVGGHRDTITLDAVGKATQKVTLNGVKRYYAAKYKVTLKRKQHVLYSKTTGTYQALLGGSEVLVTKHTTDAATVKIVKQALALPKREAKAGVEALSEQINNEFEGVSAAFGVTIDLYQWAQDHPDATTFDGYVVPAEYVHVGTGLGVDVTVSGTPQAYKAVATVAANGATLSVDAVGKIRYSSTSLYGQMVKNAVR